MRRILPVVVLLSLGLALVGCTDFPEPVSCEAACYKLEGCALCVFDGFGFCLTSEQCVDQCRQPPIGRRLAKCINGVSGCDNARLNACF